MSESRYAATKVIRRVLSGESLANILPENLSTLNDERDRAYLKTLCFGVCRWYPKLSFILKQLLKKPLLAKDYDLYALLLVGLFQIFELKTSAHAAVSETVSVCEKLKKTWAKGFVNGVLRAALRDMNALNKKIAQEEDAYFAHPRWFIEKVKKSYPNDWQSILQENNRHPPLSLRINQTKISREHYVKKLLAQNIKATDIAHTLAGIIIEEPMEIQALPGFSEGEFLVQDGASQLMGTLLTVKANEVVLDACSAPGGKLTQLLECSDLKSLIAIEKDPERLKKITENVQRLQLERPYLQCICEDANDIARFFSDNTFDAILLDAPCSATGVIRRHPDIKLLRKPEDIETAVNQQLQLLHSLWPMLKAGGRLLYATCSIFPEENEQVLQTFLEQEANAKVQPMHATWGSTRAIGRQILPGMDRMDGFYYAMLQKKF